jgi:hypothetical protein
VSHSLFACDLFCTLSRGLIYISNANPACSCVYICKFQFRSIHPPSRRLSKGSKNLVVEEASKRGCVSSLTSSSYAKPRSSVHLFIEKSKRGISNLEAFESICTWLLAPTGKQSVNAYRCMLGNGWRSETINLEMTLDVRYGEPPGAHGP